MIKEFNVNFTEKEISTSISNKKIKKVRHFTALKQAKL